MDLRRWWKYSRIRTLYYNIKYGIQNLFYYLPLVWGTRDWDYIYIYEFLLFKIKAHRINTEKYGNHLNSHKDIKRMKLCELLLQRLIEDNYVYSENYHGNGEYGKGFYSYYYHPLRSKEHNTDKDFELVLKYEKLRKNQDKELLFKTLTKHMEGWWN